MKNILFLLLISHCIMARGQDIDRPARPLLTLQNRPPTVGEDDFIGIPGFAHKKAVTVFAGTQGVGADFRFGFLPRLSARLGGSFTPVNLPNAFTVNDFHSQISLNVQFTNVHLIADFQPFGGSGFRIAFGAGYFLNGKVAVDLVPTGDNHFGDITYTPEQLGVIHMTADWKGVAPYLGLGFFRAFPRNVFNINFDFGTYYLAAPQTTMVGTNALSPNSSNNEQLQKNLSTYRWLPVLQLNFNFRL